MQLQIIDCKQVYKKKEDSPGVKHVRFKARLVAGYTQRECLDFNVVFCLLVRHTSCETLLWDKILPLIALLGLG